jgi:type III secretory pathway component EscV
MPITKGYQQLVNEAMDEVTTYSVPEALAKLHDTTVQIVDIRDIRELAEGTVVSWSLASASGTE